MKIKRRTGIIVLTILLLVATVSFAAAMMIPSADDLMTQSLETLKTITDGHAIVSLTADLPDQSISGTVEVWGKLGVGPNQEPGLRLVVLEASQPGLVGLEAVTNGDQFWIYEPDTNRVVTGRAEEMATLLMDRMGDHEEAFDHLDGMEHPEFEKPETTADAVAQFLTYFTAERDGSEDVAGGNAFRIRLVPIPEQMPDEVRAAGGFINVWLRSGDQLPLAIEYAEGAIGYAKVAASLAEINTDLDEAIFTFAIPAGAEVIEATELVTQLEGLQGEMSAPAEFDVLSPAELPQEARAGDMQQMGGAVIQRFTLPDRQSFVVAQGPAMPIDVPAETNSTETVTVRGVSGTLFTNEDQTRTLLTWQDGELSYLVGGDLTPAEAQTIAGSLE